MLVLSSGKSVGDRGGQNVFDQIAGNWSFEITHISQACSGNELSEDIQIAPPKSGFKIGCPLRLNRDRGPAISTAISGIFSSRVP